MVEKRSEFYYLMVVNHDLQLNLLFNTHKQGVVEKAKLNTLTLN